MAPDSDAGEEDACCKVSRTAATFEVTDAVEELAERRRDGSSFRDLAAYFNTRVVDRALGRAGIDEGRSIHGALVGQDVASAVYEVLHGDHSDIQRAELRARLSDAGIDVERLESSFVSHVTVRSHLQECVGVEAPTSPPPFEQTVNTVHGARTRAANVVQSTLDRAVRHGQLRTGPLEAEILVRVTCERCGDTFYPAELFDERSCSCAGGEEDATG